MKQDHRAPNRIKLSPFEFIQHYSLVLFILFLMGNIFSDVLSEGVSAISFTKPGDYFVIILLVAFLIIGYFKWKELNFLHIEAQRTSEQFKDSVWATAKKLGWRVEKLNNLRAIAYSRHTQSQGISKKITIIRSDQKVSINSMVELKFISLFSPIKNKENRQTFRYNYLRSNTVQDLTKTVMQEIIDEEKGMGNEPEWSLINTFKRLLAYLVSLGFLGIAYIIIRYEQITLSIFPILLIFLFLGSFYIVIDVFILLRKMMSKIQKRKSLKKETQKLTLPKTTLSKTTTPEATPPKVIKPRRRPIDPTR